MRMIDHSSVQVRWWLTDVQTINGNFPKFHTIVFVLSKIQSMFSEFGVYYAYSVQILSTQVEAGETGKCQKIIAFLIAHRI